MIPMYLCWLGINAKSWIYRLFFKEKLIIINLALAMECFKAIRGKERYLAIKFDDAAWAFDRIKWGYMLMLKIMSCFSFSKHRCHLFICIIIHHFSQIWSMTCHWQSWLDFSYSFLIKLSLNNLLLASPLIILVTSGQQVTLKSLSSHQIVLHHVINYIKLPKCIMWCMHISWFDACMHI